MGEREDEADLAVGAARAEGPAVGLGDLLADRGSDVEEPLGRDGERAEKSLALGRRQRGRLADDRHAHQTLVVRVGEDVDGDPAVRLDPGHQEADQVADGLPELVAVGLDGHVGGRGVEHRGQPAPLVGHLEQEDGGKVTLKETRQFL